MDNFLLLNIFFCFLIVAIPRFMQRTAYQSIDESEFKKYKIKRFGFLFKGMQGESASTHGVILPMLAIQIQGYVIGIATFAFVITNEIWHFLDDAILVVIIALFVHVFIVVLISATSGIISKKRKEMHKQTRSCKSTAIGVKIIVKARKISIEIKREPIIPCAFRYKLLNRMANNYVFKSDNKTIFEIEKNKIEEEGRTEFLKFYEQNDFEYSFEDFLELQAFPIHAVEVFSADNKKIAFIDLLPDGDACLIWIDVCDKKYQKEIIDLVLETV